MSKDDEVASSPDDSMPFLFDDKVVQEALFHFLTFLHALDLPDFARLMQDFGGVLAAAQSGDEEPMRQYLVAVLVDTRLAQATEQFELARKQVKTDESGPHGSAREHFARLRSGAA